MQSFVERILTSLVEEDVEFIVVGALSAVLHGAPVVTQDLDICYRRTPRNLERLARALEGHKPSLRGLPEGVANAFDLHALRQGTNFTLEIDGESLDLLAEMSAIGGFDEVVASTTEMDLEGVPVRVLALDKLIESKRAAGRKKDLAVLPVLEETLARLRGSALTYVDPTKPVGLEDWESLDGQRPPKRRR